MVSTNSTTVDLNESRAGKFTTVIIFCPALAVVIVALRLYSRFVLGKRRFSEDYFIVLAMLSISLQYLRISVMRFEKQLCYVLISFVVSQSITYSVLTFTLCTSFEAMRSRHIPGAKCINITVAYSVGLCLTIAMDFAILLLPVLILRHLTLRWYQKLVIAIVLSFGGLACIFSILRFTSVRASTKSKDITWDKAYSALYGAVEVNTGIICSCIVTLRPLFQRHFPFLVRWLDGVGDQHISLASWKSHVGPDPTTPQSNTTESKQCLKPATGMEHATVKSTSSSEA
ncbi:hypothetical protein DM02DRAFT_680744 [Periconia macrospinosa]|uniref:Rhodopsin domain-containing protein n=1 Tax=Periconia macrospinosa TaxID=97972 RepID=A0A2V1DMQ7_9PLEO|nr:hypothetical protein DM02DRAFT_680744 [Periconia macrospinosa]